MSRRSVTTAYTMKSNGVSLIAAAMPLPTPLHRRSWPSRSATTKAVTSTLTCPKRTLLSDGAETVRRDAASQTRVAGRVGRHARRAHHASPAMAAADSNRPEHRRRHAAEDGNRNEDQSRERRVVEAVAVGPAVVVEAAAVELRPHGRAVDLEIGEAIRGRPHCGKSRHSRKHGKEHHSGDDRWSRRQPHRTVPESPHERRLGQPRRRLSDPVPRRGADLLRVPDVRIRR